MPYLPRYRDSTTLLPTTSDLQPWTCAILPDPALYLRLDVDVYDQRKFQRAGVVSYHETRVSSLAKIM